MRDKASKLNLPLILIVSIVFALVIAGVFASTSISINSNNTVALGAGTAFSTTCDASVTVKPLTTFNTSTGRYDLTTISVKDIGDAFPSGVTTCVGETLNLAFLNNGTAYYASWPILANGGSYEYHFGARSGGNTGSIYYATSTFTAQDPTTLTSIAVSIN